MPCCAFAAFIVGQILIGLDAIKRFVLRRDCAEIPPNPASEWRLGMPAAAAARSSLALRWMIVAGAIEVVLAVGAGYAVRDHVTHHARGHGAEYVVCRGPRLSPSR